MEATEANSITEKTKPFTSAESVCVVKNSASKVIQEANDNTKDEELRVDTNTNENNGEVSNNDDDGEDLPDNFFDDFSNNDFMAGLDIVDDWIEEDNDTSKKSVQNFFDDDEENRPRSAERKIREKRRASKSPGRCRDKEYRRRRSREDNRDKYWRSKDFRSKSNERRTRSKERRTKSKERRTKSKERRTKSKEPLSKTKERRSKSRERGKEYRSRSKDRKEKDRRSPRRRSKERKRSRERNLKTLTDKSCTDKKPIDKTAQEINDARRDPEKTKRDIQRDKMRLAKDFEARVLKEQLKVAETGLVPPGTELDVVMEQEKKKEMEENKQDGKRENKAVDEPKKPVDSNKTNDRRSRTRTRSRSPKYRPKTSYISRYRRRSRSYSRGRRSRSYRRSRSPLRSTRRSRSHDREEMFRRNNDLRLQLRAKRRERYFKDLSPVSDTRISRSPSYSNLSDFSNISDREFWLRAKDRQRHRENRVRPSRHSGSKEGSPQSKRIKKTSFMEEIKQKLSITQPVHSHFPNTFIGMPGEVPTPVPPPQHIVPQIPLNMQFPPPQQMIPQNVQSFPMQNLSQQSLLGAHPLDILRPPFANNMMVSQSTPPLGLMEMNMIPSSNTLIPIQPQRPFVAPPPVPPPVPPPSQGPSTILSGQQVNTKTDVNKLFEEQKISLSDFLSVSAKPIDRTTPINLNYKIQVISKCQDAIRILKDEQTFRGRFIPKEVGLQTDRFQDATKWRSPLRKVFPVRFTFTTPSKKQQCQDSLKTTLNKLLRVCTSRQIAEDVSPTPKPSTAQLPNTAAPGITNTKVSKLISGVKYSPSEPVVVNETKPKLRQRSPPVAPPPPVLITRATIAIQTEPVKCQICEIRSARKFDTKATQTEVKLADESTQVSTDDLNKSSFMFTPRGILKNTAVQSLSHMTPAQLMALQRDDPGRSFAGEDGWNINSRSDNYLHSRNPSCIPSPSSSFSSRGNNSSNNFNNPDFGGSQDRIAYNNMLSNRQQSNMMDNRPFNIMENRNNQMRSVPSSRDRFFDERFPNNNEQHSMNDPNFSNRNPGNIFGNVNLGGRGSGLNRGDYFDKWN